jgi:glycosyltransferase involved in cell wall biosynthesis
MRYAWDQFDSYFGVEQVGRTANAVLRRVMAGLARWDAGTAGRVDRFLANSQYVAGRIRRYYNRGSTIVYPPVATSFYQPSDTPRPSARCLVVSALVPYKRIDVAIDACRRAGMPLTIIGKGPEEARLRALAGPTVQFLGWRSDDAVRACNQQPTALLLPGVEDFGMVPVEAQACGTPVVALREGGACETVVDGVTGVLVDEPTGEAFADAVARVATLRLETAAIVTNARRFSRERFLTAFRAAVDDARADREAQS